MIKNVDMERALIEAGYNGHDIYALSTDDFTDELCKELYGIMYDLFSSNEPVSMATVCEVFQHSKNYTSSAFALASTLMITSRSVKSGISMLKECTRQRHILDIRDKINAMMKDNLASEEIALEIERMVREIQQEYTAEIKTFGSHGKGLEVFLNNHTPTGVDFIDEIIKGLGNGHLVVIGARTSVGKSALAQQIAMSMSKIGKVVFVSYEMKAEELELRALSSETGVPTDIISSGSYNETTKRKLQDAQSKLSVGNILIIDKNLFLHELVAELRALDKKHSPIAYFVDYVQLINTHTQSRNQQRHLEVGDITRQLKLLAMEFNKPIVVLAQLNRVADNDEPKLSHFRESGSIEQDANMAIVMHRTEAGEYKIGILKNRNGGTGWADVVYDKSRLTFLKKSETPYGINF